MTVNVGELAMVLVGGIGGAVAIRAALRGRRHRGRRSFDLGGRIMRSPA
ncbi:hypothetical protein [Prescottella agglutinans]|nr:hypothetical protein [Prescottella agglutinans]